MLLATTCCLQSCEDPNGSEKPIVDDPNTINGHEFVDMGLSVKWASCNVGAFSPEELGDFIAWGELYSKTDYIRDNSESYGVPMGDIAGNPKCDAARKQWGGTWRMPTAIEIQELLDNTASSWTQRNGVKGRLYISVKNGNSIFLPATGIRSGQNHNLYGERGYYWSATPNEEALANAFALFFGEKDSQCYWSSRLSGLCIRPVAE